MRIALLLFLGACSGAPAPDDTSTDADDTAADTDTDDTTEDTDDTDDTTEDTDDTDTDDTDTDEEPVTPHDCLDNHGIFGLTSRWSYEWKNSSRTGARNVTVNAYDNARNTATRTIGSTWIDGAATFSETRVVDYVCDADYLYVVSQTLNSTLDVGFGSPTVVANTYTYTEPERVQANVTLEPPTPTMWTKRTVGTRVDSTGASTAFDTSVMCWIAAMDQGGYTPFVPDHYQCGSPPTYPETEPTVTEEYRWEEGIGIVNDWDTRLTAHTP
ncbi:MAG: hypothetical protein V4850_26185 [Myxococcota bacterium]